MSKVRANSSTNRRQFHRKLLIHITELFSYYQVFQQVLDRNVSKNRQMLRKGKKLVKVCFQSSYAVQISLQFDDFFFTKKSKILFSCRFEIFAKNSHLKLVGTPCMKIMENVPSINSTTLQWNPVFHRI